MADVELENRAVPISRNPNHRISVSDEGDQVKEALQNGFTGAGRRTVLYLDSLPVARSVSNSTRASNENRQETFAKAFSCRGQWL